MNTIERRPTSSELDVRFRTSFATVNSHMERLVLFTQPIVHNTETGEALVLGDPVTGIRMWNIVTIDRWGKQSPNPIAIFLPNIFSDPALAVGLITDESLIALREIPAKTVGGVVLHQEVMKSHARRNEIVYKELLVEGLEEIAASLREKPTPPGILEIN